MTNPAQHVEHVQDWAAGLSVNPIDRTVSGVALTGPESRNGYRYSDTALREAAPLYDGKPVFLDHAADRSRPRDRSTRDLVGSIVNPRFESGRIRGDIRLLDTESARTFLALVQSNSPGVGMSHVVLAHRSQDQSTVERIVDVLSVDAVINPATTRTFAESVQPPPEGAGSPPDPSQVDTSSAVGVSDFAAEHADCEAQERLRIESENRQLRDRIRQLEEQDRLDRRRTDTRDELTRALPAWAITPLLLQQCEAAVTPADRRELIRERRDLLSRARESPPLSTPREVASPQSTDLHFIATLRHRR